MTSLALARGARHRNLTLKNRTLKVDWSIEITNKQITKIVSFSFSQSESTIANQRTPDEGHAMQLIYVSFSFR